MKNSIFLSIIIIFLGFSGKSQTITQIDSIKIDSPSAVSIDRAGNFYIANKKGTLKQYSATGKLKAEYSPQRNSSITLIDTSNPLKIYIFYKDLQEYSYLDRFLTTSNRFEVKEILDFAQLISPSYDNNLWVIDLTDFGIKKYNININKVTIKTSFDLLLDLNNYDITHVAEYQNKVFISDYNSGILVFDNLANYLFKLPFESVKYFNFKENEIYFIQKDNLIFYDLYTKKLRKISLKKSPKYALTHDDIIQFVFEKYVLISKFKL